MRTLDLENGDPIHIQGARLPKGKFVKLQPQTVDFLEISDPKAVLEQALRNYPTLTPGNIIEISYNCLTFEILIMEVQPDAEGISIFERPGSGLCATQGIRRAHAAHTPTAPHDGIKVAH